MLCKKKCKFDFKLIKSFLIHYNFLEHTSKTILKTKRFSTVRHYTFERLFLDTVILGHFKSKNFDYNHFKFSKKITKVEQMRRHN